jgi:hypothetical protein
MEQFFLVKKRDCAGARHFCLPRVGAAGHIPQEKWEETFAWPADNRPPYPPLAQQVLRGLMIYLILAVAVAILLQIFTPFPVLTWLRLIGVPVSP